MRQALLIVMLLAGCAAQPVRKENIVPQPVVLPMRMCPHTGTAASLGNEGERMICERQLPIGSHLPLCVCRDEGLNSQQSAETQELLHKLQMEPTTTQK